MSNYAASIQVVKLPSIKPLQASESNCIRDLKNQVWDLQQQLSKAWTENKLLKRIQHRHTVALQHFQDSEGSLSQVLCSLLRFQPAPQKHGFPHIYRHLLFKFPADWNFSLLLHYTSEEHIITPLHLSDI